MRNATDLHAIAMPPKYRRMGDFYRYYAGHRKAPYLTLFVGGNHEASNHLQELYYGGWVAPNIYYLGAANVIRVGPLRIAGMSGIWKGYDFRKPHHERLPFDSDDIRSIYHVREIDTRKLLQVRTQVDVGLSHDWPRGVEWKGDWRTLFRKKRGFEEDAKTGNLGNVAAQQVLDRLRPKFWLSAHLHVKYTALIGHKKPQPDNDKVADSAAAETSGARAGDGVPVVKNEDEIDLDMDDEASDEQATRHDAHSSSMKGSDKAEETSKNVEKALTGPASSQSQATSKVPESLRAQLPSSFTKPRPTITTGNVAHSPSSLPFPENIKNDTTFFLALDKCEAGKDFLQLMPIKSLDTAPLEQQRGRVKLQYDKEWLAITRVFANDIIVGKKAKPKIDSHESNDDNDKSDNNAIDPLTMMGSVTTAAPTQKRMRGKDDADADPVPPNLGEAHYRPLIETEERWVEENIVQRGLLDVPLNFTKTAPVFDPRQGEHVAEPPREHVNPQTSAFCEMLGIRNPVAATEEEIEERMRMGVEMMGEGRMGFGLRAGRGERGGNKGWGRGRGGTRGHRGSRVKGWRGAR